MNLAPTAVHEPGCCALCSSSTGPFIDTFKEQPGLGRVYVCSACAGTLAQLVGYAPVDERVATELAALRAELEEHRVLRIAVAHTLREGAVVRRGRIQPRMPKGHRAVEV